MNLEQCLPCVEERRPYGEGHEPRAPRQGKLAARFLSGKTPNLENRFLFLQTAAAAHPLRQHIYLFFLNSSSSSSSLWHLSNTAAAPDWLAERLAVRCEGAGSGSQSRAPSISRPPFFSSSKPSMNIHPPQSLPLLAPPPSLSGKKIPSEI